MKHGKLFSLVLVALLAFSAHAEIEPQQNDGYAFGESVNFQPVFQFGEVAAARFVPQIPCPCLVTDISLLVGGAPGTFQVGIKIWQDPEGEDDPGLLLIHESRTVTASDDTLQVIDMVPSSVVVNGPFRVGFQMLQLGLPAIATDADGTIDAGANFMLMNTGLYEWYPAVSENMPGDFIIRATVDNSVLVDVDNDGVLNELDNCVNLPNADQRDSDNDSIGNRCDPDVALPNDCIVNFLDFAIYRDNFLMTGNLDTDNNGDGITNFIDMAVFANHFLASPGTSAQGCDATP